MMSNVDGSCFADDDDDVHHVDPNAVVEEEEKDDCSTTPRDVPQQQIQEAVVEDGGREEQEATPAAAVPCLLGISVVPCKEAVSATLQPPPPPQQDGGSTTASRFFSRVAAAAHNHTLIVEPMFLIVSQVSAEYAGALSPRKQHASSRVDWGAAATNVDAWAGDHTKTLGPPRMYRVRRNLAHFVWLREQIMEKHAFTISGELPSRDDAQTIDGIDQIVALLFMYSSLPQIRDDLVFWTFLTQPDEAFENNFNAIKQKEKPTDVLQKVFKNTAKRLLPSKLPQRDLKPAKISDMLMETGVVDRALVTLDKVASCVGSAFYFTELVTKSQEPLEAWNQVADRAYDLRHALEDERQATLEVADALRDLAFPSYWPWTREQCMEETVLRPSPQRQQSAQAGSSPLGGGGGTVGSPQTPGSPNATVERIKPPLSQRLTHYLHRTANVVAECGRLSSGVVSEEFVSATSLLRSSEAGKVFSAKVAHDRLLSNPHQPKPAGRSICDIQSALVQLIETGSGHEELDALDTMDDEISHIHEFIDEAIASFERHHRDIHSLMERRWLADLKQLVLGQNVCWKGAILLFADLKTSLELDRFLDEEELPFTNAAVVHNPSPQQKRRFEEHQKIWGEQITSFFSALRKGDGGDQQNSSSDDDSDAQGGGKADRTGFRALFTQSGSSTAVKRRSAFRDEDEKENPFDTDYEMQAHQQSEMARRAKRQQQQDDPHSPSSINVLPEELQEVMDSQSRFSLLGEGGRKPHGDAAHEFDDRHAKENAKKGARNSSRRGAAAGTGWGSVATADDEDPFRF